MTQEATRSEIDDYFGLCPQCVEGGVLGDTDLLWRNIGRDHYLCCDKHKVYWWVGSNLFSGWRNEPEEIHRQNAAKLETMKRVESASLPQIILRLNDLSQRNSCAVCDHGDRMDTPLAASFEGTDKWVCLACLEKRFNIHGLARIIDYLNGILYRAQRTSSENLEAFLCNLDSAVTLPNSPDIESDF